MNIKPYGIARCAIFLIPEGHELWDTFDKSTGPIIMDDFETYINVRWMTNKDSRDLYQKYIEMLNKHLIGWEKYSFIHINIARPY